MSLDTSDCSLPVGFLSFKQLHYTCQFSEMEDPDANEQTKGFINKTEDLRVRRETEKTTEKQM